MTTSLYGSETLVEVGGPALKRETRIVKDRPVEEIAKEIVEWIEGGSR